MKTRFYVLGYTEEIKFDPLFEPKRKIEFVKGKETFRVFEKT